ncbi:response regulator [Paenibacillus wulumuqiensis]|uniref:response regulator n=1 Tax=Paenibacillus wulumuqiensis TaxID=1567107 RepID=UPI000619E482|nr:response regulator [Paenibacillus wulumuqiensis]
MRQLLIVDDEKNIRQGLQVMIEREFPGQYKMHGVRNGQEALERLQAQPADILITDIRMPVLDGIGMLEKLRAMRTPTVQPYVIVLSGYDDFEYAKAAIRYQVREYLLKPIRREDLFEALQRIGVELQQQDLVGRQLEEAARYRQRQQEEQLCALLYEYPAGSRSSAESAAAAHMLPADYHVCVFQYRDIHGQPVSRQELQLLLERLAAQPFCAVVELHDREERLVWIVPEQEQMLLQSLAEAAARREVPGLQFGVSTEGQGIDQLAHFYREACTALEQGFFHPGLYLLNYEPAETDAIRQELPEEQIRLLGNILGTGRTREISSRLQEIFHGDDLSGLTVRYVEEVSRLINESIMDEVFRHYGEPSIEIIRLYQRTCSLQHYRYFREYYRDLESLLICLDDYIGQLRLVHSEHRQLREAVEFIQAHYDRPLNMAMVSNHVSLNYSYFSEAFKAYTGENFVLYLKKVRIGRAKELLANSPWKLSDISEMVGFENNRHFSRVFRELEGISPQDYRAKMQLRSTI